MFKFTLVLVVCLSLVSGDFLRNGVLPIRRGEVRAEVRVGEIMIYEPYSALIPSGDTCLLQILAEVNAQADKIFPSINFPNTTGSNNKFIGLVLAGAAMGVASGALATGIAATIMATSNKKHISENRNAINTLRDENIALKAGLDLASSALDEVSMVIGSIQGYINNDLIPVMANMSCEIKKNTFRTRLLAYWLSLVSKYQNLIANPWSEEPSFSEEQRIKNDASIAALVTSKYGIPATEFKGPDIRIRISLIESKDRILLLMASIYRTQLTGRNLVHLPRIPLSDTNGGSVISNWPNYVVCEGTSTSDCYTLSETCTIENESAFCTIIDVDSPINLTCDEDCGYVSSPTSLAFMGDGEGGAIVNCALISCRCDGRNFIGMQHFLEGSCSVLLLKGTIALRLRELGEIIKDPVVINSSSGHLPPAINLQNNISDLAKEMKVVTKDVGDWGALGGLSATPYPFTIWLVILTVMLLSLIVFVIVLMVKMRRELKRLNSANTSSNFHLSMISESSDN
ncbi:hemagglutinin-neuraminidase [Wenling hoplichthys paramyxovirus]|uniref:Fusion glycoprotein F0 n=1 Tax=Wenling hoplichthys paramyxovirus TaxID=2116453 RepID=A0A2P1GNJ8_9MONO|nr:hemagglutinin-neuraminidase [Wenling hoplichthys paramyxovirus]AVM87399.1 hemagglutinin-neuraminidase [Wenling hoplichthys paramyxovirus]